MKTETKTLGTGGVTVLVTLITWAIEGLDSAWKWALGIIAVVVLGLFWLPSLKNLDVRSGGAWVAATLLAVGAGQWAVASDWLPPLFDLPTVVAPEAWFLGAAVVLSVVVWHQRRGSLRPAVEPPELTRMSAAEFAQYASDLDAETAAFGTRRYRESPKESDIKWPEGDSADDREDARLLSQNYHDEAMFHQEETEAEFRSRFQGKIMATAKEAMRRELLTPDTLAQHTGKGHYKRLLREITQRAHEALVKEVGEHHG